MGGVKRSSSRKIAISDFKGILANLSQFQPPPPPFSGGTQLLSNLHLLYSCREFFLSELFGPQHNLSVPHLQKAVLGHYQHKHQQHHQHRNCDHPHRHHQQQQHHQQCSNILIISKKQYLSTKSAKGDFWITLQRREIQTSHRKTLFSQILIFQQRKSWIIWDQYIDLNETWQWEWMAWQSSVELVNLSLKSISSCFSTKFS